MPWPKNSRTNALATSEPSYKGVIVGLDYQPGGDWAPLEGAQKDAEAFAELLTAQLHWPLGSVDISVGRKATQTRVSRDIEDALDMPDRAHELVVIYFAGHAEPVGEQEVYLVTASVTRNTLKTKAIPVSSLVRLMERPSARYVVLILDCCYSGMAGHPSDPLHQLLDRLRPTHPALPQGFGRAILASSWHDQVSMESGGHGYFTRYLIEGLSGDDPPATHRTFKQVDAGTLHGYVLERFKSHRIQQVPELFVWGTPPVIIGRSDSERGEEMDDSPTLALGWRKQAAELGEHLTCADLSPDGDWVATGHTDGSILIRATQDGAAVRTVPTFGVANKPIMLSFSPDSRFLAVVRSGKAGSTISLLELARPGEIERELVTWDSAVERIKFHPGSELLAACSANGDLVVWSIQGEVQALLTPKTGPHKVVNDFAFCYPAGKQLVVAYDQQEGVEVWDIYEPSPSGPKGRRNQLLTRSDWRPGERALHVVASSSEDRAAASIICATAHARRVCGWNLAEGSELSETLNVSEVPMALAMSADGDLVACGTLAGAVIQSTVVALGSQRKLKQIAESTITSLVFPADRASPVVAAAAMSGDVKVWNRDTLEDLLPGRKGMPGTTSIRFSQPATKMLIATIDATSALLEMWHLRRANPGQ